MSKATALLLLGKDPHGADAEGAGEGGEDEAEGPDSSPAPDGEREAFDQFAEAAAIPEERRDDAFEAFRTAVEACVSRSMKDEY